MIRFLITIPRDLHVDNADIMRYNIIVSDYNPARSTWRIERNCRPKRPDADGTHPRHTVGLDIAAQRRNTRY